MTMTLIRHTMTRPLIEIHMNLPAKQMIGKPEKDN